MRIRCRTRAVVLVCALAVAGRASGQDHIHLTPPQQLVDVSARIVNGVLSAQYPSVGILMDSSNPNLATLLCSGTLIGCQTFLTAGHCVAPDHNPQHYSVFLQHAGFFNVSSIIMRPDFNEPVGDVAVLKLSTPVAGIPPSRIDTTGASAGAPGLIVGFGRTGGGFSNADYGLKRSGDITTAACTAGVSDTTSICWDFVDPLGPPGSNADTCNGDSGGPLFIDYGAGDVVAGVTSGGTSATCFPTDHSYDANVFFYHSWIQAQGGADLNKTSCGNIQQVGQPDTAVFAASGQLSAGTPQGTHSFQVGAGATQLRVAMNGIDDGSSDFDLYVKQGSAPTPSSFDCKADGTNQYGYCQFDAPTPGTWYVLVNRFAGSGTYQVTATTFGGTCGIPGSDGNPCDDNNACTQNDTCQSGSCVGTAVTDGTPCDDGNVCTNSDTCQSGVCSGNSTPPSGCQQPFVPHRGLFRIQDKDLDQQDKLLWNWSKGTSTTKQQFGDPVNTTDYKLCVYDQAAGINRVVLAAPLPAGGLCGTQPCWKDLSTGFRYADRNLVRGPIKSIRLLAGVDGKAKISIRGDHAALTPALPLAQQNTVTVQLSNGTTCWEARYGSNLVNTPSEFAANPN